MGYTLYSHKNYEIISQLQGSTGDVISPGSGLTGILKFAVAVVVINRDFEVCRGRGRD